MGWIPAILAVALVGWFVLTYNVLVRLRNQFRNAWYQIDVQLTRRHDLIPNLVEVVKDYMAYEQETLTRVIEARGAAISAKGATAQGKAENLLTESLKSLFAVVEKYPVITSYSIHYTKLYDHAGSPRCSEAQDGSCTALRFSRRRRREASSP